MAEFSVLAFHLELFVQLHFKEKTKGFTIEGCGYSNLPKGATNNNAHKDQNLQELI